MNADTPSDSPAMRRYILGGGQMSFATAMGVVEGGESLRDLARAMGMDAQSINRVYHNAIKYPGLVLATREVGGDETIAIKLLADQRYIDNLTGVLQTVR